ncbi:MAG TPA: flagellar hook-basal body complex protein FliE [Firmicutes bacterium]|nr:flagellar hook-basal body complex protein FliE [Bacillota bacterium]
MPVTDLGLGRLALAPGGASGAGPVSSAGNEAKTPATEGPSFGEVLRQALGQVNSALQEGDAAAIRLATGEAPNLHEVVLATERANLALQFTMAIRNKLLEAYNELMRMPV